MQVSANKTLRFSDLQNLSQRVDNELNRETPRQDVVDYFEGGKSPGVAAYRNMKSMEALAKRVEPGTDPTVRELRTEIADTAKSRLDIAKNASYAIIGGLGLVAVASLVHATGVLDLGTVGQVLNQSLEIIGASGGMLVAGISAAKDMVTKGPMKDLDYLVKMTKLAELDQKST